MNKIAKVEGPLFSFDAGGKIANTITSSKWKNIKIAKKYVIPEDPKTEGQENQRNYLKDAVNAWKTDGYSVIDYFAWELYASIQKKKLSGYNMFLREWISNAKRGLTWHALKNCIIQDIGYSSCIVLVDIDQNRLGRLYLGTSKKVMLKEHIGIFEVDHYKFSVTGLLPLTKYFFYIKNVEVEGAERTGIYSFKTIEYVPEPLEIGNDAIDRFEQVGGDITLVDQFRPANKNGNITKVEIFCPTGISNVRVASFYVVSGNFLSTRDYEIIGDVPAGYSEHNVSITVQEGDYIGIYCGAGDIDSDSNGVGRWAQSGNNIPCENVEFFYASDETISLHGTGPA